MADLQQILESGQPYFGPAIGDDAFLRANQGDSYFKHFAELIEYIGRSPLTILEIGSWAGNSLYAWELASGGTAHFVVIDPWIDYIPDSSTMTDALRSGDIERLFWHNMRTTGIVDRLQVLKEKSQNILPTLKTNSIDIVFIDGDHRYEYVRADIINSIPLIRKNGILCGDDLHKQFNEVVDHDRRVKALNEGLQCIIDADEKMYHPGITTAVHEIFGHVTVYDNRLWVVKDIVSLK
jgi:Methyltransferase domain